MFYKLKSNSVTSLPLKANSLMKKRPFEDISGCFSALLHVGHCKLTVNCSHSHASHLMKPWWVMAVRSLSTVNFLSGINGDQTAGVVQSPTGHKQGSADWFLELISKVFWSVEQRTTRLVLLCLVLHSDLKPTFSLAWGLWPFCDPYLLCSVRIW